MRSFPMFASSLLILGVAAATTGCAPETKDAPAAQPAVIQPGPPNGSNATASTGAAPDAAPAHGPNDGHDHGPTSNPEPPGPMMGGGGPMAGGPMTGGGGAESSTATPELDKKIEDLKKSGNRKKLAAAYTERGRAREMDDNASPRTKYRSALKDFRTALKLDPTNADAKQWSAEIENIYKSMGRPVPTDEE